ncbi:MAG: hypothetical protein FWC10_04180, partial [Lentimicrobiaceae bacterium]|nr:hypothetical protein [Lentimicrobiaceae bacterium]
MKKINKFNFNRFSRGMRMCLIFLALLVCSITMPTKTWAQGVWDAPFNSNYGCYIMGYTTSYIRLDFPHYADAGSDRYISNNVSGLGDAGSAIYYSTNGGSTWTVLVYVYNRDQNSDNWYWSGLKTASTSYTVYATTPRFGSKGGNGMDELLSNSWLHSHYNKDSDGWTHTGLRWNYTNIISDKAVIFKHEGVLRHNSLGSYNFTWYGDYPIVVGNPLHAPTVSACEILPDGKLKITANISGYTSADDNGSYYSPNRGMLLQSQTSGFVNTITCDIANNISNHTSGGPHVFTTTAAITKAKLNSGETYRVGSWRRDYRCTSATTIGGNTGYNLRFSNNYAVPSYPQPSNLSATLTNGKVKLTWNMVVGATNSPTDGYTIQWRVENGVWADVPGVTKNYDRTETTPSVEFDYPEYNAGKNNYEFRIKRANMNWGAKGSDNVLYEAATPIEINTDHTEIANITAQSSSSGITLNWTLTEGVIKSTWKYRITRVVGATLLTNTLDITARTYFDNGIPSCQANSYRIEIIDGTTVIREITSSSVVRPT